MGQAFALSARGFDIGSHTVDHPILTRIPPAELTAQLADSKRQIEEQLGAECSSFAYPNGGPLDVSSAVLKAVRSAGYKFAFTVMGGLAAITDDLLVLDRVYAASGVSLAEFRARISGFHNALKRCFRPRASAIRPQELAAAVQIAKGAYGNG